jgi:hypothetical protein
MTSHPILTHRNHSRHETAYPEPLHTPSTGL